ncbi:PIG-L family deacetylase [Pseudomonadales bacterium]|nr:PIG-L family deacetylase [Pseudomonadales bacterium]
MIAAHADDEVLGCGGTIAKYKDQGATINVALLADGVSSRVAKDFSSSADLKIRNSAAKSANKILGVDRVIFGNFPDNRMDSVALLDVVKYVEDLISQFTPDVVFTHYSNCLNIDHRVVNQAVCTACRPQTGFSVTSLLFFEIPSSTEWQINSSGSFSPNLFEDISSHFDRKIKALEVYSMEMRDWPHPRSVDGVTHLAKWRGATVGVDTAEAFIVGRILK